MPWDNQGAVVEDRNTLAMDHQYIEEQRIADRYLDRTLPTAERLAFEKHFVDCPECLDRLALAEMFRDTPPRHRDAGIPIGPAGPSVPVPVAETVPTAVVVKPGKLRQANTQTLEIVAIFCTAALLFVSVPAAYFLWQYANDIRIEQGPATGLFVLHRGVEVTIQLGTQPHPVVFLLDIEKDAVSAEKRVLLVSGGKVIWNGGSLAAVHSATPGVLIPARALVPGLAELRIEAKGEGGQWRVVADYPLRIVRINRADGLP